MPIDQLKNKNSTLTGKMKSCSQVLGDDTGQMKSCSSSGNLPSTIIIGHGIKENNNTKFIMLW